MCRLYWELYGCGCARIPKKSGCCKTVRQANTKVCVICDIILNLNQDYKSRCYGLELERRRIQKDCSRCQSSVPCQELRRWREVEERRRKGVTKKNCCEARILEGGHTSGYSSDTTSTCNAKLANVGARRCLFRARKHALVGGMNRLDEIILDALDDGLNVLQALKELLGLRRVEVTVC